MNENTTQNNTKTLKENIISRIEREHILPTSKVIFNVENIFFWTVWTLSVLVGAVVVAILIFTELNVGWEFYELTHTNALTFFIQSLPYIWMVLLVLTVLLGIYNLRKTKKGYRHSITFIVLLSLFGSIVAGLLLHVFGASEYLESEVGGRVPFHTPVSHIREVEWQRPELGMYAGTVEMLDVNTGLMTVLSEDNTHHVFDTRFLPREVLKTVEEHAPVHIIATSSTDFDSLVACHLGFFEGGFVHTLEEILERRAHIRDEFTNASVERNFSVF